MSKKRLAKLEAAIEQARQEVTQAYEELGRLEFSLEKLKNEPNPDLTRSERNEDE